MYKLPISNEKIMIVYPPGLRGNYYLYDFHFSWLDIKWAEPKQNIFGLKYIQKYAIYAF